ncbi:MAG: hypothetical protein ACFFBP_16190, partial [Promethearchaeota archaeon]
MLMQIIGYASVEFLIFLVIFVLSLIGLVIKYLYKINLKSTEFKALVFYTTGITAIAIVAVVVVG